MIHKNGRQCWEPIRSEVGIPAARVQQDLYVDLMFVNGLPFLVSVSELLHLTHVSDLHGNRHETTVRVGLEAQVQVLTAHALFKVTKVHSDGEGALSSIVDILATQGLRRKPAGPE